MIILTISISIAIILVAVLIIQYFLLVLDVLDGMTKKEFHKKLVPFYILKSVHHSFKKIYNSMPDE